MRKNIMGFFCATALLTCGAASAGEAAFTAEEVYRLVPDKTSMVALLDVRGLKKLDETYVLSGGKFDVLRYFAGAREVVSGVVVILKGRDRCAMVFKCPKGADPLMRKMVAVLTGWGKRGKPLKALKPGLYLRGGGGSGQVLAKLSDKEVLWTLNDDEKGSLGLEVKKWHDAKPVAGKYPAWLAGLTTGTSIGGGKALISWVVSRPDLLENDGVSHAIRRFKKSRLWLIKGRMALKGGKIEEIAVYRFKDDKQASEFKKKAEGKTSNEHRLLKEFSVPWQYFLARGLRAKAPPQFPDEVKLKGKTVTTRRAVTLPRRKAAAPEEPATK